MCTEPTSPSDPRWGPWITRENSGKNEKSPFERLDPGDWDNFCRVNRDPDLADLLYDLDSYNRDLKRAPKREEALANATTRK